MVGEQALRVNSLKRKLKNCSISSDSGMTGFWKPITALSGGCAMVIQGFVSFGLSMIFAYSYLGKEVH